MAQSDILVKIDGIDGESQDKELKNHIEIYGWGFSIHAEGSFQAGTGGGKGKAIYSDFNFSKAADVASAPILQAIAEHKHIKEVTINNRKGGGDARLTFVKIKLTNVRITNVSTSAGADGSVQESVSMNFEKIEYTYQAQDEKGAKKGGEKLFLANIVEGK